MLEKILSYKINNRMGISMRNNLQKEIDDKTEILAIYELLSNSDVKNYSPESWVSKIKFEKFTAIFIDVKPDSINNYKTKLIKAHNTLQQTALDTNIKYVCIFSKKHSDMDSDVQIRDVNGWSFKWSFLELSKVILDNLI